MSPKDRLILHKLLDHILDNMVANNCWAGAAPCGSATIVVSLVPEESRRLMELMKTMPNPLPPEERISPRRVVGDA